MGARKLPSLAGGVSFYGEHPQLIFTRRCPGGGRDGNGQLTAIEDKESIRWIEGLAVAQSIAMAQPEVRMICLADSEADIYEYLSRKGMVQNSLLPVNGRHAAAGVNVG